MTSKPHICILTTAHPVDDVRVYEKFCCSFLAAGWRVTWVGPDRDFFGRRPRSTADLRLDLFPAPRGRLSRLLAHRPARRAAGQLADIDVYYTPEPDAAAVALRLASRNGAKVIFDVHEVFHGPILDRWLGGERWPTVRELLRRRIAGICAHCDLVLGVNDEVIRPYASSHPARRVVRSCAPVRFAASRPADVCGEGRGHFTLMHGKTSLGRGSLPVLEAVHVARRDIPNLRVIMFGSGAAAATPDDEAVVQRIRDLSIEPFVELRPAVTNEDMPAVLQECDVGLIAYGRRLGLESLPNRLFEYMAAGLPVLAPAYSGAIAAIVNAEKCGRLADYEAPAAVAQLLVDLHRHPDEARRMGQRGREAFLQRHNWETEVQFVLERIRTWHQVRMRTAA